MAPELRQRTSTVTRLSRGQTFESKMFIVHGLATHVGTAITALHEELPQVSAILVFLEVRSSPQMDRTGKSDRRDEREHVSVSNLSSVNKAIGQQTLAHGASFLGGPLAS